MPVVLENAGHPYPARGWRRQQQGDFYIVWRWDAAADRWQEVGRTLVESGFTWVTCLKPLVVAALADAHGQKLRVVPALPESFDRIRSVIDTEMAALPPEQHITLLNLLHQQLAGRIASASPLRVA